jgi:urease accessory protein
MSTDGLLTLTQWLSPGFPVSAYAYSHGLEQVVDSGALSDATGLRLWLEDVLAQGSGRNDAILLASAWRADPADLGDIDAVARAVAASAGRLTETVDQGAAFARTVNDIWHLGIDPLCYPVAVGRAARLKDLPLDATLHIYVHAFLAALVSAAVRLVPLGQTEGQAVLAGLAPLIADIAEAAEQADLDSLASSCFALDIAAMRHETQYSKVFRT